MGKLLDEVAKALPKKGQQPWHTVIDPALLKELEAVKKAFRTNDGTLPAHTTKTGLAFALAKSLKARGIDIGRSGVQRWLES